MSCRSLSANGEVVLEALAARPATNGPLAEQLGWETGRATAVVDRLRSDGFVFGGDHIELSGSGRYHLPSEEDRSVLARRETSASAGWTDVPPDPVLLGVDLDVDLGGMPGVGDIAGRQCDRDEDLGEKARPSWISETNSRSWAAFGPREVEKQREMMRDVENSFPLMGGGF